MRERYLDHVRKQILGNDLVFRTPYGLRNIFYADYTASGRALRTIPDIRLVGSYDTPDLTSIVSFNIVHRDRILHPKFVTKLLNDLFGIQSRAGCSCAGPYGHLLLGIDTETSGRLRGLIGRGWQGIKPGWVRINIHYTFDNSDIDFLVKAVEFAARSGHLFLRDYSFDWRTGEWRHLDFQEEKTDLSLENDFRTRAVDLSGKASFRAAYFHEAQRLACRREKTAQMEFRKDPDEIKELKYFYYAHPA